MQKSRILIIIACVAFLVILINTTFTGFISISLNLPKSEVSKKIETLYELANPGTNVEVLTLKEESGLYKVFIKAVSTTGTNYAEIYVTKTLWPDFSKKEFMKALRWFSRQKRNFGR